MKKILISSAVFAYCILNTAYSFSQGYDLVFNRVILVSSVQTVPADRVWKITSVLPSDRLSSAYCNSSSSCGSASTQQIISVNGSNVYMASSDAKANAGAYIADASAAVLNRDIWLPADASLAASTGVLSVSVLEFLLIPK